MVSSAGLWIVGREFESHVHHENRHRARCAKKKNEFLLSYANRGIENVRDASRRTKHPLQGSTPQYAPRYMSCKVLNSAKEAHTRRQIFAICRLVLGTALRDPNKKGHTYLPGIQFYSYKNFGRPK